MGRKGQVNEENVHRGFILEDGDLVALYGLNRIMHCVVLIVVPDLVVLGVSIA